MRMTELLQRWGTGDKDALDVLMPQVHGELRNLAAQHMRRERGFQTLQATALVSETYLKLLKLKQIRWEDRDHFFAIAARLMRRILVDAARARNAQKRGGNEEHVPLDEEHAAQNGHTDLLFVEDALRRLQSFDARKAQVVELRVFAGLSVEEIAGVLNLSPETVKRDWRLAKAWLAHALAPTDR